MYHLGNEIWSGVFAVPNCVADEHLKMASGLAVKVLLLLLRHAGDLAATELAGQLNQSPADVQDALNYWQQIGVIQQREEASAGAVQQLSPSVQYRQEPEPARPAEDEPRRVKTLSSGRQRLSTQEINEMAEKDESIAYLLQEAQSVLGKALTPVSTDLVVALYSYYAMKPDMILMLVHYCVSIGKDSMRYIEKVAADWLDRGIDTHEKAEAEIVRLTKQSSAENQVKKAFGIYDRNLVPSEKKYIQNWTEEYRLGLPLITLAYERTVETKGKLSFPYINGILANWSNKGITTTVQAMQEIRGSRTKQQDKQDSSYDMGELEQMIAYGDL